MKRIANRDIVRINPREPFIGSNLEGVLGYPGKIRRPWEWAWGYPEDWCNNKEIIYTIYSYNTPIAVFKESGWEYTTYKHSVTTSKHLTIVKRATS